MKIESSAINGSLLGMTNQPALFSGVLSKNINNQIANLQEQLKEIDENKKLSSEERTEMKKKLNAQIESLGKLLQEKQAEMEMKSKEMDPDEKDSESSLLQSADPALVSVEKMMAVIKNSGGSEADVLHAVKTTLEGNARILAGEIDTDAARGLDTTEKTKQLADMQARIQTIDRRLAESASGSRDTGADDDKDDEQNKGVGSGHFDIIV
jgi:chromosome segregation ATPase